MGMMRMCSEERGDADEEALKCSLSPCCKPSSLLCADLVRGGVGSSHGADDKEKGFLILI